MSRKLLFKQPNSGNKVEKNIQLFLLLFINLEIRNSRESSVFRDDFSFREKENILNAPFFLFFFKGNEFLFVEYFFFTSFKRKYNCNRN